MTRPVPHGSKYLLELIGELEMNAAVDSTLSRFLGGLAEGVEGACHARQGVGAPSIHGAKTQAEATSIQKKVQKQVDQAIISAGLSVSDYNRIGQMINSDEQTRLRYLKLVN